MVLPKAGSYVIAVSGGVDSMALLHRLHQEPDVRLVVAHFDHGIREGSVEDRKLVQATAQQFGLRFVFDEGHLGPGASEAKARQARYQFLRRVRRAAGAEAIITAHHHDDVLETAILNLLRGTGRKGLTSLQSRPGLVRPLLKVDKRELVDYARQHQLVWLEDSTNQDQGYLRNYVRHTILPRLRSSDRLKLVQTRTQLEVVNQELDALLAQALQAQNTRGHLDRQWFNHLPHTVAREVLAAWLRTYGIRDFGRKTLERLVVAAKTGQTGQQFDVLQGVNLRINSDNLALRGPER